MLKNKGFSLIELIVAIAILGILLGIAVFSGSNLLERYRVEGQMKEMNTDLMNARVSALQRNRFFFVTLAANQYAVYEDTNPLPDGDGTLQTAQDRLVMRKTTKYALNFSSANFNFAKNGLVSLSSGTIWITSAASPVSDCIALASTRILMGKMNGTACTVQ